jgi:hypothetical protein
MADLRTLLAAIPVADWGEPVSGPEAAFRNKAKMLRNRPFQPLTGAAAAGVVECAMHN